MPRTWLARPRRIATPAHVPANGVPGGLGDRPARTGHVAVMHGWIGTWVCAVALAAAVDAPTQGWDEGTRARAQHLSQGTWEVPWAWFVQLEVGGGRTRFAEPRNLARYGLLPARGGGLPVGLARSGGATEGLGLTCAACHTGAIEHDGRVLQIDGAPGRFDVAAFLRDLHLALWRTRHRPARFARFAARVLGADDGPDARRRLAARLDAHLRATLRPVIGAKLRATRHTRPGPGRVDALGMGLNRAAARERGDRFARSDAPVDFPALWGTGQLAWYQYNGAVAGRGARDRLQATLTAGSLGEAARVDDDAVRWLGEAYARVQPPRWPSFLPAPEAARVVEGARLYRRLCEGCHGEGEVMVPLARVGTDPTQAQNFARRVRAPGTAALLDGLADAPLRWRAPLAYRARALTGVWATGPFLHNGSVPTLYALLSPVTERPRRFWLGGDAFDAIDVGPRHHRRPGARVRDTRIAGNANTGHEFADRPGAPGVLGPALGEAERRALVEFLKTL